MYYSVRKSNKTSQKGKVQDILAALHFFCQMKQKSVLRALSPDLFPFSWSVFVTFRKTGTVSSSIYIEKAMENKLSICLIRKKESEHYKNLSFSI